ncbi:hypothetical protein SteCoe_25416 [Stentor coeruleus]|uniref:Arrestin C-terminal-like domain-containing protein n=1 Tax=Stentor coeruleus TaxID=5963 RepID=A0A1R2BF96_9CILI|nr:hypothetical protein SteCoe_25416 [Stentor coeruleus]
MEANTEISSWVNFVISPSSKYFMSGGKFQGLLSINVLKELTPSTLKVSFTGVEKVHIKKKTIQTQQGQNNSQTSKIVITECTQNLFSELFCEKTFPFGIVEDTYSIPLEYQLPDIKSASLAYKSQNSEAFITYTIDVSLECQDGKILNHSQEVLLFPKITNKISISKESRLKICCANKGVVRFTVLNSEINIIPDKTTTIYLEIDNSNSKISFNALEAKLYYMLTLKTDSKVIEVIVNNILSTKKVVNVPCGDNLLSNSKIEIDLQIPAMNDRDIIFTTCGEFIKCDYFVEIEAVTDSRFICLGDFPDVKIPVIFTLVPLIEIENNY